MKMIYPQKRLLLISSKTDTRHLSNSSALLGVNINSTEEDGNQDIVDYCEGDKSKLEEYFNKKSEYINKAHDEYIDDYSRNNPQVEESEFLEEKSRSENKRDEDLADLQKQMEDISEIYDFDYTAEASVNKIGQDSSDILPETSDSNGPDYTGSGD